LFLLLGLAGGLQAHAPSIGLTSRYLNFVAAPGGPNPAPQTVTLSNTTHGRMFWTAAVDTGGQGNWLSISPNTGTLPGLVFFESQQLSISAASAGLAAGVYFGTITITAPGDAQTPPADNTPQVISVALTISASGQAAPGIALAPASLFLEGVRGTGRVYSQTLRISNVGGGTLNWSGQHVTESGGNWLSLTPAAGSGGEFVTVSAAVGDLGAGVYSGRIVITAAGAANSPQSIPVTFRVREPLPPTLSVSRLAVSFSAMAETGNPSPESLFVGNLGEATLNWSVAAATFNGGSWLEVTPRSGTNNGSILLSADPSGLGPGTYLGRVTLTAEGAVNSPLQVPVTLQLRRPTPLFSATSVVNAATFVPSPIAPGQILSIFGLRLGPADPEVFTLDPETGRLPTTLAGVQVTFDDVPAPLFFVSERQINLQVPFEIASHVTSRMRVTVPDLDPAELSLAVAEASPGIFTLDGRRAAALNQDNSANTPENPAAPGSVIQLFVTGQGAVNVPVASGGLAPESPPFPAPVLPVSVSIDALSARVLFAGLAPGFAGLLQVNAEIPRAVLPASNIPVTVAVGVYQSAQVALIAVR
jgi:uncharacterized protein (TIGR03437 family)